MSMSVQEAVSGSNTLTHVTTASVLGGAFASILAWVLQLLHATPPPEVTAAFGVVGAVVASWVMQKLSA